jgi:TatD DNase family protein
MFIDTHAHLCDPDFAADLAQVIDRAQAAKVSRVISISTDVASARETLDIARRFEAVHAAVGLHPGEVPRVSLCDMKDLGQLAAEPRVVAIGETGLDYFRAARTDPALQQQQKDLFWAQLELAKERHLPVVIHNRSAERDMLEILRAHAQGLPKVWRPWGVMHCFSGPQEFASACLEIGLLISYTGILTFKNAEGLRDVAKQVSLDHVMLETDAPYLAPMPNRRKRNEPACVPLIAEVLAKVKETSVEEVARATTENARRLFRLP